MSWEPEIYHIAKATRRPLVSWYDLPEKIAMDWFGYIEGEDRFDARLFSYKGAWYDLQDGFMHVESEALKSRGWHGIMGESYFSGILCRYPEEDGRMIDNQIVVALVHW